MLNYLSDEAKLWIYSFIRKLNSEEKEIVSRYFSEFTKNWKTHGKPVSGSFEIAYDQFLLLATDDDTSGCSIDSSVNIFRELNDRYGLNGLSHNSIYYIRDESVKSAGRFDFIDLVENGKIPQDTLVFNPMITTVGELRSNEWLKPLKDSWFINKLKKSA